MKIKENLAKQNLLRIMKKNRLWSNPNNDTVERAVCMGYVEGFDKAREMVAEKFKDFSIETGYFLGPYGEKPVEYTGERQQLSDVIKAIGEEECHES